MPMRSRSRQKAKARPPYGFVYPIGTVMETPYGKMTFVDVTHEEWTDGSYRRIAVLQATSLACTQANLKIPASEFNRLSPVQAPTPEPPSQQAWWTE